MRLRALQVDARKAFDAGIGSYIRHVVPRVARLLDVDVELIVCAHDDQGAQWASSTGLRVVRVNAPALSRAEQIELRRRLRGDALFWATSIAHPLFVRRPLFATIHDLAQVYGGRAVSSPHTTMVVRLYFSSLVRVARGFACVSKYTYDQLIRFAGRDLAAVAAITPLGVDPVWRAAGTRSASDRPYFVFVGSTRRHKNLPTLVRAFIDVAGRVPHSLVLAGSTAGMSAELRTALDSANVRCQGRICVTGLLPERELIELVAGATAFVFPSRYEGFGLPPLESMAAGCPVIAAGVTAIPEVCGGAARYFDPDSPTQLSTLLIELASMDAVARRDIVAAGQRRASEFTWDRCAEATAEVLRRCLG
jgi:glycosyltransferase involved in cell wall biosynthesis